MSEDKDDHGVSEVIPIDNHRRCRSCGQKITLQEDRQLTLACGCDERQIKVCQKLPDGWDNER